jgi:GR25 family glycosyltransferase involved in LPS biosynthesis
MSNILKHIYYINLERRADRWEEALEKINNTCLKNYEYTRFNAFDGSNEKEEEKRFTDKRIVELIEKLKTNKVNYKKGELGVLISHLSILIDIQNNPEYSNDAYFCIFEDDFFYSCTEESFNNSFTNLMTTDLNKMDIEFLYLGGRFEPNFYSLNEEIYEMTDNINIFLKKKNINTIETDRCLSSYMIRKSVCLKLIDFILNKFMVSKREICHFKPVDRIIETFNYSKVYDYFPHLFYSPRNYKTDIQKGKP